MNLQQKAAKGDMFDDPEDTFESFLERFSELTQGREFEFRITLQIFR